MKARIAVLPGDGIGPEVTAEAVAVLRVVAARHGHDFDLVEAPVGGAAIEATGEPLPASTLAACRASDAILLGAVGGPRWDALPISQRPEQALLALRREFDLFANLRPVAVPAALVPFSPLRPERLAGVDLLIVRELTSGLYFGPRVEEGQGEDPQAAHDTMLYRVSEVERVARVAFEAARGRRGKVTSVDKANVLAASRLWRRTVERVAQDFPEITLEHALVDSCAMRLITAPASFDVVLTGNLFGDILSDGAAVLPGSLGVLPSASLGASPLETSASRFGLYEPIHGSAPDLAGLGRANPLGTILSAALLLRHSLGLEAEAQAVEAAVAAALAAGVRTADLSDGNKTAASTTEVGAAVRRGI